MVQAIVPKHLSLREVAFFNNEIDSIKKQSEKEPLEIRHITTIAYKSPLLVNIRHIVYEIIGGGAGSFIREDTTKTAHLTLTFDSLPENMRKQAFEEIEYDINKDHFLNFEISASSETSTSISRTYKLFWDSERFKPL